MELTREVVARRGVSVDMAGFEKEMEKQRERARASHKFEVAVGGGAVKISGKLNTEFVGYHRLSQKATIVRLVVDGGEVETIGEGQEAGIVLDTTPFYGEMGGQVGDTGEIRSSSGRFEVTNTVRACTGYNRASG